MTDKVRKWILGGAVTAAAVGAVVFGIVEYQAGQTYDPVGAEHALNVNQVVFPDGDKTTGQRDSGGDSELWQKDHTADDTDTPRQNDNADYLFESQRRLSDAASDQITLNDGGSGQADRTQTGASTVQSTASGSGAGTVYDLTGDAANADLIISGEGGATGEGTGSAGTERPGTATPQPTRQPSVQPTAQPTTPPTAAPTAQPTVRPDTGATSKDPVPDKGTPSGGGNEKPFNEKTDPIPPNVEPSEDYPWDGITISLPWGSETMFYVGQTLTPRMIYNMLSTYVTYQGTDYYWGASDYDKYISITGVSFDGGITWERDFPVTIPEGVATGDFLVEAKYRFTTDSSWTTTTAALNEWFDIEESCIFVLNKQLKSDDETIDPSDIILSIQSKYAQVGEVRNLLSYLGSYLGEDDQTMLFPGWTEHGKQLSWFYTVESGRHVLQPADGVPFDTDMYKIKTESCWMSAETGEVYFGNARDMNDTYIYLQTLYACSGDTATNDGSNYLQKLTVPQYVQAVYMPFRPYTKVDTLELPDTVLYVDTTGAMDITDSDVSYDYGLQVTKAYTVSANNPRYTAENGLLYNKDKTSIEGVPTEVTQLTVPASVTSVTLTYRSKVQTLTLEADSVDTLPQVNYGQLPRTGHVEVNADLLDDFLLAECDTLRDTSLHISAIGDPEHAYKIQGDYAMTDNGTLHMVLSKAQRWLSLSDSVKTIGQGALKTQPTVTTLMLPASGTVVGFEENWAQGSSVKLIYCYSEEQYNAAEKAAPTGCEVQLVGANVDGYTYIKSQDNTVLLLGVPADLQTFDGTVPDGNGGTLTVTAIGDSAFKNCQDLVWVDLPTETTAIGYQAFMGCTSLQGVMIRATDTISIAEEAFAQCNALRFVASNAHEGDVWDEDFALTEGDQYAATESDKVILLFAPFEPEGYTANWTYFDDGPVTYDLVNYNGTRILYGVTADGTKTVVLRSGTEVNGALQLPATVKTIYRYAFNNARTTQDSCFTINWNDLTNLQDIRDHAFESSSLGQDITLPDNVKLESYAFASCNAITSIVMPGSTISLGELVFQNCTNLSAVTFGVFRMNGGLQHTIFSGCDNLQTITFTSVAPAKLILHGDNVIPYYFNRQTWSNGKQEEENLRIIVPEGYQQDYLEAWRYAFAGYYDLGGMNAYQRMWSDVRFDMIDWDTGATPTNEEVAAALDEKLLVQENRARTMLGMPTVESITHKYAYTEDENGNVTLTAAHGITAAELSAEEVELPYGKTVAYIASNAFAGSPDLDTLLLPETVLGIHHNAFSGADFTNRQDAQLTLVFFGLTPPQLIPEEEGKPFSFGVDDDHVAVWIAYNADESVYEEYLNTWLLPMAGYTSEETMWEMVRQDLAKNKGSEPTDEEVNVAISEKLAVAEARLRKILGLEEDADEEVNAVSTFSLDSATSTLETAQKPTATPTPAPTAAPTPEPTPQPATPETAAQNG